MALMHSLEGSICITSKQEGFKNMNSANFWHPACWRMRHQLQPSSCGLSSRRLIFPSGSIAVANALVNDFIWLIKPGLGTV